MSPSVRFRPIAGFGLLLALVLNVHPGLASDDDKPKKVDASLVVLTPMAIASVAIFDEKAPARDAFVAWVKPVFAAVESQFANEKARRTVVVQVCLHPDRVADVAVAGRPALTNAEIKAILKAADAAKAPRTRIADCELRIEAKINGGDPGEDQPLTPPLSTSGERRVAEFRAATTPAKLTMLRRWARTEAIPLMAQMASEAEPKYEGVRNLAKALQGVKREGPIDVAALTDKNPDFWRAMMEMAPGIPLVPGVSAMLHVANGEIDSAQRIVRTFAPFDRRQSGYSTLLGEFMAMSDLFSKDVKARIGKGIALHDSGKFDAALAIYESVLKDYPQSAWAHYERYQSLQAKALQANKALPDWDPTRKAILKADAHYGSMAQATDADELYDLVLRKEAESLFREQGKNIQDFVRYADIAVDLGQPGFAAMIDWNLVSNVKPADYKNRDLIEDVLYCLEQLGVKEIKKNFKGDHAAQFARIDAERATRKKESPGSKAMVPKGEK